jgi:hypothetical protein
MTEEAAQAKRLFDSERWQDAWILYQRVVRGDTGDDEGNRQIAAFYGAVASYRAGELGRALAELASIVENRNHLKYDGTLPFLDRLGVHPATCTAASDLLTDEELYDALIRDWPPRPDLALRRDQAHLLAARGWLRRGDRLTARKLLDRVRPESPYQGAARACRAIIDQPR